MESIELDPIERSEHTRSEAMGCRALVAALILQAIKDVEQAVAAYRVMTGLAKARLNPETLYQSLRIGVATNEWTQSESTVPFSLRWCCDTLDMDYDRVRMKCTLPPQVSSLLERRRDAFALLLGDLDALDERIAA